MLFLFTILLLLLFSVSFTFAFGDAFSVSMTFARFVVADDGGGVDVFVDRTEDLGDAFSGDGFTRRSVIK